MAKGCYVAKYPVKQRRIRALSSQDGEKDQKEKKMMKGAF